MAEIFPRSSRPTTSSAQIMAESWAGAGTWGWNTGVGYCQYCIVFVVLILLVEVYGAQLFFNGTKSQLDHADPHWFDGDLWARANGQPGDVGRAATGTAES